MLCVHKETADYMTIGISRWTDRITLFFAVLGILQLNIIILFLTGHVSDPIAINGGMILLIIYLLQFTVPMSICSAVVLFTSRKLHLIRTDRIIELRRGPFTRKIWRWEELRAMQTWRKRADSKQLTIQFDLKDGTTFIFVRGDAAKGDVLANAMARFMDLPLETFVDGARI